MKKLTNSQVKSITKPGRYHADDTLYLCVKPSGRKSWVQRVVIDGRRADIGLGPYPVVTLAEARDLALDNRRMIRRGTNPLADRRRARMPTFRVGDRSDPQIVRPVLEERTACPVVVAGRSETRLPDPRRPAR